MASTHFDISTMIPLRPYTVPLIIWDFIENYWSDRNVTFTEDKPKEAVERPVIAWSIHRKVNGREGVETLGTRSRTIVSSDDPSYSRELYAQWQTIIYQFDLFHTSNQEVNALSEDFEDLMTSLTPSLQKLGVTHWIFEEQVDDDYPLREPLQDISKRRFRYRCVLERRFIKSSPIIEEIWIRSLGDERLQENEPVTRSSSGASDTLSKKWASSSVYITKALITTGNEPADYIENIDYNLNLDISTGIVTVKWADGAKKPLPGNIYYVSYRYKQLSSKTSVLS